MYSIFMLFLHDNNDKIKTLKMCKKATDKMINTCTSNGTSLIEEFEFWYYITKLFI